MASVEELESRIAVLEALLNPGNGNLVTPGNITSLGHRESSNPLKWFLGRDWLHGLYFFFQERFAGQGSALWGGFETYQAPPDGLPEHAAWGYGALPGRAWFQNFLLEANGNQVGRNVVVERVYLQTPVYRDLRTGKFVKPDHYDAEGVPYIQAGATADEQPIYESLGGIYYDTADLGTYLTREDRQVVLYNNGRRTVLA